MSAHSLTLTTFCNHHLTYHSLSIYQTQYSSIMSRSPDSPNPRVDTEWQNRTNKTLSKQQHHLPPWFSFYKMVMRSFKLQLAAQFATSRVVINESVWTHINLPLVFHNSNAKLQTVTCCVICHISCCNQWKCKPYEPTNLWLVAVICHISSYKKWRCESYEPTNFSQLLVTRHIIS